MHEAGRNKVVIAPLSILAGGVEKTRTRSKKGAGAEMRRPVALVEAGVGLHALYDARQQFRGVRDPELRDGVGLYENGVESSVGSACVGRGGDFADAPAAAMDVGLCRRNAVEADAGLGGAARAGRMAFAARGGARAGRIPRWSRRRCGGRRAGDRRPGRRSGMPGRGCRRRLCRGTRRGERGCLHR